MHEWYAAPMEGLTGWRWRQVQHEMFGGAALYVTPFVSPNGNFSFQRKELEEMDPERNRGIPVVPQVLTNRAEYFVWAAKECRSRGWEQVDLNLGCPSGTVTGKNKGAGLLRQPELLPVPELEPEQLLELLRPDRNGRKHPSSACRCPDECRWCVRHRCCWSTGIPDG